MFLRKVQVARLGSYLYTLTRKLLALLVAEITSLSTSSLSYRD